MGERSLADQGLRASIDLPAEAAYVATARIFGSALARHFGAQDEVVEDLKLAISEACSLFIRAGADGGGVRVEVLADGERLAFRISGNTPLPEPHTGDDTPTPGHLASQLGVEVIRALLPESEVESDPEGSVVEFAVRLGLPQG